MPDYSKDALGNRMKQQYENRTRYMLPRRTYTVIRVDGKAFHSYTRFMHRPYDTLFITAMNHAATSLFDEFQGASLAFIQSDEISLLLTDFTNDETCAAFDGNLQKLCSIAASATTCYFNISAKNRGFVPTALFDARVFTIPDPTEVKNYFIWRQKDAERNSVQMLAQHYASHKELEGKDRAAQHDIIHNAGDNWNNHPAGFKRGRVVTNLGLEDAPIFTEDRTWLISKIPRYT